MARRKLSRSLYGRKALEVDPQRLGKHAPSGRGCGRRRVRQIRARNCPQETGPGGKAGRGKTEDAERRPPPRNSRRGGGDQTRKEESQESALVSPSPALVALAWV